MTPLIELRDGLVRHGRRVVLDIPDLAIQEGERLAIMGPNGSGKSSLLRILGLLEVPTRGTVRFHGEVPDKSQRLAIRRRMASVFQASLLCDTTVHANVGLGLRFRRYPRVESDKLIRHWLDRLGIGSLAFRSARTLSGGEAQRTSLARGFVVAPEVLFLDEAFGALDAPTREALLLDTETILRDSNITVVFATHERAEAQLLATRVAILLDGRIAQIDAPTRVFAAPASEAVARFVGFENILPARVLGVTGGMTDVEVNGTLIRVGGTGRIGESALICVRAEDIRLLRPEAARLVSDRSTLLSATVRRVMPAGGMFRLDLDAGFRLRVLVNRHLAEAGTLAEGSQVHASIPAAAVHLIPVPELAHRAAASSVA